MTDLLAGHIPYSGEERRIVMYGYEKREINKKRKMRRKQHRWIKFVSKTGRITHSKTSLLLQGILFGLIIPVILSLIAKELSEGGLHLYPLYRAEVDGPFVVFLQNYMILASYCILAFMTGSLFLPFLCMIALFFVAAALLWPIETFWISPTSDAIQEWAESVGIPLVIGAPLYVCFIGMAITFIQDHEILYADARQLAGEKDISAWEYEYKKVKADMRKHGEPHSFDPNSYVFLSADDVKMAYREVLEEKANKKRKRVKKKDPNLKKVCQPTHD